MKGEHEQSRNRTFPSQTSHRSVFWLFSIEFRGYSLGILLTLKPDWYRS